MKKRNLLKMMMTAVCMVFGSATASAQEPYAVLSEDKTVLTFYFDENKESNGGMDVGPFTITDYGVNSGWSSNRKKITEVVFDDSFANCTSITSTAGWFYDCNNLQTITGISNFNTENVTDMSYMFFYCYSMTSLDLSSLSTGNVVNMSSMFQECHGLKSVDLSNFNTENVTNMSAMFSGCWALNGLDLSSFNTANVTDMSEMFFGCEGLTSLDISNFNTENVASMFSMFCHCEALTSLDLSNFNTENVTNMGSMFRNCNSLWVLDLSSFNTKNVTNMNNMFEVYGNSKLKTIFVDEEKWSTESLTKIDNNMFSSCDALVGGNGTKCSWEHIGADYACVDKEGQPGYFSVKVVEPYAVLSNSNTVLTFYYDELKSTRGGIGVGPFTDDVTGEYGNAWFIEQEQTSKINTVVFDDSFADCTSITSTAFWFYHLSRLRTITGLSNLNTENVTDMRHMFEYCSSLRSIDLSNFNTENVTNMRYMFHGCPKITNLDLSTFNTENVTDMIGMFSECGALECLDLSGFNTANVTGMESMFNRCSSLTSLDLTSFNTENVTDMSYMFNRCSSLTSIDLSSFNTENVVSMDHMFSSCSSLTSLDLQSFKTTSLITMYYMFESDANLETIYVDGNNWILTSQMFGGSMFSDCTSLVGGNGTTYDEIHIAHEYACVDKEGQPGYLTDIVSLGISGTQRLNDKKQTNNDKWYSLDGRRVQGVPMQKGVYIYKGKKVVKE